ncbi:MAG: mechanosensitive ion channel, partial [Clostridia bacterium]
ASIIAVLGTCGVAIGLALKDSLGNLASGLMIILNKPFKKGDYIEVGSVGGVIDAINLFNTTLITYDNKKVVLPNSTAINNPLVNANGCETRRVDLPIFVAKGTELETIKKIVGEIVDSDERVLKDPVYTVRMTSQSADCVEMTLKAWTKHNLYWDVLYDLNENIYLELTKRGIIVPNRQLDVTVKK